MLEQEDTTKHYPYPGASIFIMSSRKSKKHQFRPAMDEGSNIMHDEHIRKTRDQEKL